MTFQAKWSELLLQTSGSNFIPVAAFLDVRNGRLTIDIWENHGDSRVVVDGIWGKVTRDFQY